MKWSIQGPYHLLFLPLVFIANRFFTIVSPDDVERSNQVTAWLMNVSIALALILLPAWLLYLGLKKILDNKVKAAVLVTVTLLPFLFFQDMMLGAENLLGQTIRARWIMLFLLVLLIVFYCFILFSKKQFSLLNEYLNVTAIALLLYNTAALFFSSEQLNLARITYKPHDLKISCSKCPDVYFIILDSYTSNASLKSFYNYDNKEFSTQLRALGFTVLDDAYSNYDKTIYSLAATLNLNEIGPVKRYNSADAVMLIKNNTVTRSFKNAGYEIKNYTLFDLAQLPRYYYSIFYEVKNEHLNKIFQNTILKWVWEFFLMKKADAFFEENSYRIHNDILEQLKKESAQHVSKPKFIYAHLLAPHPPYVMDSLGDAIPVAGQADGYDKPAYLSQVKGLNKLVYATVNNIMKNSLTPPVIIIQGDHGSRIVGNDKEAKSAYQAYIIPANTLGKPTTLNKDSNDIFKVLLSPLDDH